MANDLERAIKEAHERADAAAALAEERSQAFLAALAAAYADWVPSAAKERVAENAESLRTEKERVAAFKGDVEQLASRSAEVVARHIDVDEVWQHRSAQGRRSIAGLVDNRYGQRTSPEKMVEHRLKDRLGWMGGELAALLVKHEIESDLPLTGRDRGYKTLPWHRDYGPQKQHGPGFAWQQEGLLRTPDVAAALRAYGEAGRALGQAELDHEAAVKARDEAEVTDLWDGA